MLDRLDGRETCDLVDEVAQPVVARVIGSFMGITPEDDIVWARLMNNVLGAGDRETPDETDADHAGGRARDLRALPGADRRTARDAHR